MQKKTVNVKVHQGGCATSGKNSHKLAAQATQLPLNLCSDALVIPRAQTCCSTLNIGTPPRTSLFLQLIFSFTPEPIFLGSCLLIFLPWCYQVSKKKKTMYRVALDVLPVHASSVPLEHEFSLSKETDTLHSQ